MAIIAQFLTLFSIISELAGYKKRKPHPGNGGEQGAGRDSLKESYLALRLGRWAMKRGETAMVAYR